MTPASPNRLFNNLADAVAASPRRHLRLPLLVTCAGAIAALLLTGCSATTTSGAAAAPDTAALTVGSDLTYPPYTYMDGAKPAGFDIDFVTALAAKLKVTPTFQDTRFEQLIPSLNSGRIDLIASALYITAERAKVVDYIPYFSTGNSIVVLSGANGYADAAALCGVTVGVIKGAAAAQSMRGESSKACVDAGKQAIDVREFNTDPEATQAVLSHAVDAELTDAAVAASLLKKMDGKVKISSAALLYPIPVGLAVKKGNAALKQKIETALATLKSDGEYDTLLQTYNLEVPDQAQVDSIIGN